MKKVLVLAENWPPRVGGIERYLTSLLDALPTGDFDVTAVVPKGSDTSSTQNVTVIPKRFFWRIIKPKWIFLYFFLLRFVQKEQIDVIVCGKGLFEGLVAYYMKKRLGIPYIVCTYEMEIHTWFSSNRTKKKLLRVLHGASAVVNINKGIADELHEAGVTSTTIHPGLPDTAFTTPTKEDIARAKDSYGIGGQYIFTLARLVPRKGIDDLIRAFASLDQTKFPNLQLVIAGDGDERAQLEKIAAHEYVQPLFIGKIPDADITPLMAGAEIFALTPKDIDGDIEGFGIVYLEASATGTPIIATKTGGVPEAVQDGVTGVLATSGNVDSIKDAIIDLLDHPEKRRQLGANGKEHTQKNFSITKQAALLGKLLNSV